MVAILDGPQVQRIQFWQSKLAKQFQRKFKNFLAEFSIFSHGGHLGQWAGSSDIILKGDHQKTIPAKFGPKWPIGFGD